MLAMPKTTYLNNGAQSGCEICVNNAVTVVLRDGPIKLEVCDDCQEVAIDLINELIVDQFG